MINLTRISNSSNNDYLIIIKIVVNNRKLVQVRKIYKTFVNMSVEYF